MICQLCEQNKPLKSNTHFLSDFIIRTALNQDGCNVRNKALMFEFSSEKSVFELQFQQVEAEKIEKVLGRETTDEENEIVRNRRDFAVDDVFCKGCEDKFTNIETQFSKKILPKFKEADLTNVESILLTVEDSKPFRMFFLMQFYRASIFTNDFDLPLPLRELLADSSYQLNLINIHF